MRLAVRKRRKIDLGFFGRVSDLLYDLPQLHPFIGSTMDVKEPATATAQQALEIKSAFGVPRSFSRKSHVLGLATHQ